jgi:hypothetical protein
MSSSRTYERKKTFNFRMYGPNYKNKSWYEQREELSLTCHKWTVDPAAPRLYPPLRPDLEQTTEFTRQ